MAKSYNGLDRTEAFFAHYGRKGMKRGMNIYNPDYKPIGEKAQLTNKPVSSKKSYLAEAVSHAPQVQNIGHERANQMLDKDKLKPLVSQKDKEQAAQEQAAQASIIQSNVASEETRSQINTIINMYKKNEAAGKSAQEEGDVAVGYVSALDYPPQTLKASSDRINKKLEELQNKLPDSPIPGSYTTANALREGMYKTNLKKMIEKVKNDNSTTALAFKLGLIYAVERKLEREARTEALNKGEAARQKETARERLMNSERERQAGRR